MYKNETDGKPALAIKACLSDNQSDYSHDRLWVRGTDPVENKEERTPCNLGA